MFVIFEEPLLLSAAFAAITLALLLLDKRRPERMWRTAGFVYACYILASSLGVFVAHDVWRYSLVSLGCSALYVVVVGCLVQSAIQFFKLQGSSEGAMVFLILMYHPLGLLAAAGIRWAWSVVVG